MPKRAERRHHEERVKAKFKKIVKRQTKWMEDPGRWEWRVENGRTVSRRHIIDRSLPVKRLKEIEKQGAQMAHHPRHDCELCRLDPKAEKHRHEFELARKSPEINDGEE